MGKSKPALSPAQYAKKGATSSPVEGVSPYTVVGQEESHSGSAGGCPQAVLKITGASHG